MMSSVRALEEAPWQISVWQIPAGKFWLPWQNSGSDSILAGQIPANSSRGNSVQIPAGKFASGKFWLVNSGYHGKILAQTQFLLGKIRQILAGEIPCKFRLAFSGWQILAGKFRLANSGLTKCVSSSECSLTRF
jgi:hypothetical protein